MEASIWKSYGARNAILARFTFASAKVSWCADRAESYRKLAILRRRIKMLTRVQIKSKLRHEMITNRLIQNHPEPPASLYPSRTWAFSRACNHRGGYNEVRSCKELLTSPTDKTILQRTIRFKAPVCSPTDSTKTHLKLNLNQRNIIKIIGTCHGRLIFRVYPPKSLSKGGTNRC